ncbi:hypothetical protein TNCV_4990581 [Trichonephila clavipes]|nr:hypothetical protein TNCV_4990581 [Trichonephila clavipes]
MRSRNPVRCVKLKRIRAQFVLRLPNPNQMETRQLTVSKYCDLSTEDATFLLRQSFLVTEFGSMLTARRCSSRNGIQHSLLN